MKNDFLRDKDDRDLDSLVENVPVLPDDDEPPPPPEKFTPLPGDKVKLTRQDYGDHVKAGRIINSWESNPAMGNILSAADLNNIGCAYVWVSKPNDDKYAKAKKLFLKAQSKDPKNKDIQNNLNLFP